LFKGQKRKKNSKDKDEAAAQHNEPSKEDSIPTRPHIQVMSGVMTTEEPDEDWVAATQEPKIKTVRFYPFIPRILSPYYAWKLQA
jgi:hypothetical protein